VAPNLTLLDCSACNLTQKAGMALWSSGGHNLLRCAGGTRAYAGRARVRKSWASNANVIENTVIGLAPTSAPLMCETGVVVGSTGAADMLVDEPVTQGSCDGRKDEAKPAGADAVAAALPPDVDEV